MKIAYLALRAHETKQKASTPKKKSADELRRAERLAAFKLRDWKRVEIEYAEGLKEIREVFPGWMPAI